METATDYQHNRRLDKGATDISTADFLLICIRTNTISSQCHQLLNIIETSPPSIVHNHEAPEGREPEAPEGREPEAPEGREPEAPEGRELSNSKPVTIG